MIEAFILNMKQGEHCYITCRISDLNLKRTDLIVIFNRRPNCI